ncbi:hypothetical protein ScPMuIL_018913 [Solemya velum]
MFLPQSRLVCRSVSLSQTWQITKQFCSIKHTLSTCVTMPNMGQPRLHHHAASLPVLTMYTKQQCSLCDVAKRDMEPFRHRFELNEVDITLPENMKWFELYQFDIPVFHGNGQFLMKHKIDTVILEKFLKQFEVPES